MPKRGKTPLYQKITLVMMLFVLVSMLAVFFLRNTDGAAGAVTVELEKQPSITPPEIDFPSTDGGTFTGWAGETYFIDAPDEVVVLFTSATVPGLAILYYPYEERIVVGTPQMVIDNVPLFNGQKHQVSYSFSNGGEQKFYYDGKLKASAPFALYQQNDMTGMVTGTAEAFVAEGWEKVEIT